MPSCSGFWNALRPRDQPHAAGALVDDRGAHCLLQVILARLAAGVDQAGASHVAVGHLVAHQVDRVVGGEFAVHLGMGLAELDGVVAAVVLGHFLLHDVGVDGRGKVIGLSGQVGGNVVILVAQS